MENTTEINKIQYKPEDCMTTENLELNLLMANYTDINAKLKLLEDKKDSIRSKILINIKTNEIEDYEYNGIVLKYSMQKRKTLDKAKLEAFLNAKESRITDFEIENQIEMLRIQTKESIDKYRESNKGNAEVQK